MGLVKGALKWSALSILWLASVISLTTSELMMDVVSDGLSKVLGVTTPYAKQKNNSLRQKTVIKNTRAKSQRLAVKIVSRNVFDLSTPLIPVGGAVIGVGLAAADVYAACELIDIQNELSETLDIPAENSVGEEICLEAVATVESLPGLPGKKAAELDEPDFISTSRENLTEWWCSVSSFC